MNYLRQEISTSDSMKLLCENWTGVLPMNIFGSIFTRNFSAIPKATWKPGTKRIGMLALKKGMTSYYDEHGVAHAVTVLHVDDCEAVRVHRHLHGSSVIELGAGYKNPRNWNATERRMFELASCNSKKAVIGFHVSQEAEVPVGTKMYASHFVPGQFVDVQATSIGKGFQGAMKRWGFKGLPASHGVTLKHRSVGSIGSRSEPGKVFKGKRMPGRMGGETVTVARLKVMKIDHSLNCIYVKGAVPGHDETVVKIKDSLHNPIFLSQPPPFPTVFPSIDNPLPRESLAPTSQKDPLHKEITESS